MTLVPEEPEEDRLLLIDGHAIMYRSFYAIRGLATSSGFPTNAIYGYLQSLEKVLKEFPSSHVVLAMDSKGKTIRHEEFEEYKANRPEMPEELARQIPKIEDITESLGYRVVRKEGYEADDVIAKLANLARDAGMDTLIFTGDKDLAQLVDDTVKIVDTGDDNELEVMDAEGVEEKYGVPPEMIRDFLALIGDTSDNIPGVPQVGEVRAQKLLSQFDSLEDILEGVEEVDSTRVKNNLIEHGEVAREGKHLVELREDFELEYDFDDLRIRPPDITRAQELLKDLELASFLEDLGDEGTEISWELVNTEEELGSLASKVESRGEFAFDIETDELNPIDANPVGISIALEEELGYYVPISHGEVDTIPKSTVLERLKPLFEDPELGKIGQNLKFDGIVLKKAGVELSGITFDSMIASYLLKPTKRQHNLKEIIQTYLGREVDEFGDLFSQEEEKDFRNLPIDEAGPYAASDATIIWTLKDQLEEKLKERNQRDLFRELELPLINVLRDMEYHGIKLDTDRLAEGEESLRERLDSLQDEINDLAGEELNPNSPKQVRNILFEELDLPVIERTKTGPSTNARVLEELSDKHPLPEKIIEFRELSKLLNTYVETLPDTINPRTGRIHTSFNQTATATGRLSSSDPNLQNIPKGSQLGSELRKAFVAPEGKKLIGADYSQVELRILAHLSEDEELLRTFERDEDLHTKTAAEIFDVGREEVDEKMRDRAKRVNFGIVYGITEYGLSRDLGIPREEAEKYIDRFFDLYPRTKEFMDHLVEIAEKRHYASTMFNRRRYLPNINSKNWQRRNYDRRNAINTPIQGSAADLMKVAMLDVKEAIDEDELPGELLLQIHDELIMEVPWFTVEEVKSELKGIMEHSLELKIPLKLDVASGDNWGEL
ncbi:DNA polymerase I [Candidatus Bipolaricaulota bacterium]|nr:DNA polymerase I [Candidatus Bipolaricaulota bacterium]